MVVLSKERQEAKTAEKGEIDQTLNKIFTEMNKALAEKEPNEIERDRINKVLNELIDAVNQSAYDGKKTKIPDFKRIIDDEF